MWDTSQKIAFRKLTLDVFKAKVVKGEARVSFYMGTKSFYVSKKESINQWIKRYDDKKNENIIGYMENPTPDFQNNNFLCVINKQGTRHNNYLAMNGNNLIASAVYFAVRHAIAASWLNDRDQFYAPNFEWEKDSEFQSDCLAFMLFHGQNKVTGKGGGNNFNPFSEKELGITQGAFESDFMQRFLKGKIEKGLFKDMMNEKITFSKEAKWLLEKAKSLFSYYHTHSESQNYLLNASLYDIKEFFQGRDEKGKMKRANEAKDEHYKILLSDLNEALGILAKKIEPKIYEYEFLQE